MKKTAFSLILFASLAVLWASCADRKDPNLPEEVHPAQWMKASSEDFHGSKIALAGLVSCPSCHGQDYKGGTSEVSCTSCHNGPSGHPFGWLNKTSENYHGAAVITAQGYQQCASCHGEEYKGKKNSGGSCYICHNGPSGHPAQGWLVKTNEKFHGLAASSRGIGACADCHGEDYSGGWSGTSCKICHPSQSGHPSQGWLTLGDDNFHGTRWMGTGTQYCAGCHGADLRGGDADVSCYTCHNGASGHPVQGWLAKTSESFHGLAASSRGLTACAACHGSDYAGGISETSCKICHTSQSGHPSQGWMTSTDSRFHGVRLSQTGTGYCAGCHGEDFQGGDADISCYTCHNGPSGHPAEGWLTKTSESFHGLAASSRGLPACSACHGTDYEGGISETSCKICHTSPSGHPAQGWMTSTDNRFHGVRLSQTGTQYCAGCHGEDFQGGDAGVNCFTCHNGPSGHPYGWLDKNNPNYHGARIASEGITSCTACHGADFSGGISGVACSDCHGNSLLN